MSVHSNWEEYEEWLLVWNERASHHLFRCKRGSVKCLSLSFQWTIMIDQVRKKGATGERDEQDFWQVCFSSTWNISIQVLTVHILFLPRERKRERERKVMESSNKMKFHLSKR